MHHQDNITVKDVQGLITTENSCACIAIPEQDLTITELNQAITEAEAIGVDLTRLKKEQSGYYQQLTRLLRRVKCGEKIIICSV